MYFLAKRLPITFSAKENTSGVTRSFHSLTFSCCSQTLTATCAARADSTVLLHALRAAPVTTAQVSRQQPFVLQPVIQALPSAAGKTRRRWLSPLCS